MAYCTASQVKAYLGTSVTADDTLLGNLITRATSWIDEYVGFAFEAGADTTRHFDVCDPTVIGDTLYFDKPCAAITTVTNGDSVVIASTYYVTLPRNDAPYYGVKLKSSSGYTWTYDDDPEGAISIAGKWAWSASAPSDIEHAAIRMAAWMYHQRNNQTEVDRTIITDGAIITPASIPTDILSILNLYRRMI